MIILANGALMRFQDSNASDLENRLNYQHDICNEQALRPMERTKITHFLDLTSLNFRSFLRSIKLDQLHIDLSLCL